MAILFLTLSPVVDVLARELHLLEEVPGPPDLRGQHLALLVRLGVGAEADHVPLGDLLLFEELLEYRPAALLVDRLGL
jgi:hypothetical protein